MNYLMINVEHGGIECRELYEINPDTLQLRYLSTHKSAKDSLLEFDEYVDMEDGVSSNLGKGILISGFAKSVNAAFKIKSVTGIPLQMKVYVALAYEVYTIVNSHGIDNGYTRKKIKALRKEAMYEAARMYTLGTMPSIETVMDSISWN